MQRTDGTAGQELAKNSAKEIRNSFGASETVLKPGPLWRRNAAVLPEAPVALFFGVERDEGSS